MTAKKKKPARSRAKQPTVSDVWLRVLTIEQAVHEIRGARVNGTPFSLWEARRDLADINCRLDEQKEVLTELSRTLDKLDEFTRSQVFFEVCDIATRQQRTPWYVRSCRWMCEAAGDWYSALLHAIKRLAR